MRQAVAESEGTVRVSESTVTSTQVTKRPSLQTRLSEIPTPRTSPIPSPIPVPMVVGSRFFIWKQDPSVRELGPRLAFIPNLVLDGPRDARFSTILQGVTPVSRTANGDFVFPPDTAAFDCGHTFAVARQTLTMYERLRGERIRWAWNTDNNTDPLEVHPRAGETPNAFYSRALKACKFFFFTPTGQPAPIFTCRSLDIVAHEIGHAILDGLKPQWLGIGNPPQTGATHESFGDLTAIFLALSQFDQIETFVALTKSNLHAKNFLADLAEQFGGALGRTTGLRNADNDLKVSQVGNEVHALSQVFTGAVYDILADIFAFQRHHEAFTKDPAQILLETAQRVAKLLLRAILAAPVAGATFADVANKMLQISNAQGDPPIYRTFMRNHFAVREVVVSPTPLTMMIRGTINYDQPNFTEGEDILEMSPFESPAAFAPQDRTGCCGTMQLPEFAMFDQRGIQAGQPLSEEELLRMTY